MITASSGNHGIGVATAAASRGFACTIYLPEGAAPSKIAQIRRLGAEIVLVEGTDTSRAEMAARRAAEERGITYVSPYNDPRIIAGQGTIGKEILEDGAAPDAVVVSVGGGGLISGIATWIKASSPSTLVIGASAANDRAMAASIDAGEIITPHFEPTFSDGTAEGSRTTRSRSTSVVRSSTGGSTSANSRSLGRLPRWSTIITIWSRGLPVWRLRQPHTSPIRTPVLGLSPSAVVPTSVQRRSRRCWRWPTARPTSTRSRLRPRRTRRSRPRSATPNPGRSGGSRRVRPRTSKRS